MINFKKIKVLYVSANGYLGGAEKFLLTAASAHRQGSSIDASILFFSEGEAVESARQIGLEVYTLRRSFKMRNLFKFLLALLEIRRIVKKISPDIIHNTMPYSHITMSLATIGLRIKKVWFQHGPVGGRLDQIANLFPADEIFYNSSDLKTRHHKTWPLPRVRNAETIIHMGVALPEKTHPILQGATVILGAAGRLCSWKGFHNIIIALGALKDEGIHGLYQFKIAGTAKTARDKSYEQYLRELVIEKNLTNEVSFLGHQADMADFFQDIDIFIHSSTVPEPFGLVVAEAMSWGRLVIGSNVGGVTGFLQHNSTGITYASTTDHAVTELKKHLREILTSSEIEKLQTLASNGQAFIKRNHSVEKMIEQIEKRYTSIL